MFVRCSFSFHGKEHRGDCCAIYMCNLALKTEYQEHPRFVSKYCLHGILQGLYQFKLRRSLFGYFCRRCFVSYAKLSFSGLTKLRLDYQAWCAGDSQAGYEPVQKDQLNSGNSLLCHLKLIFRSLWQGDLLIHKTQTDKKAWAKPDAYEA